jgi:hypothetical protein
MVRPAGRQGGMVGRGAVPAGQKSALTNAKPADPAMGPPATSPGLMVRRREAPSRTIGRHGVAAHPSRRAFGAPQDKGGLTAV